MMMRKLSRLHREESGIAMVVAMMVVFVVVLLSIVILDLSIHNVDQAAYDRKRVTSVAASEACIDPRARVAPPRLRTVRRSGVRRASGVRRSSRRPPLSGFPRQSASPAAPSARRMKTPYVCVAAARAAAIAATTDARVVRCSSAR